MKKYKVKNPEYIIKIISSDGKEHASQYVDRIGSWYFSIYAPLESVYAELGTFDNEGNYHVILRSECVVLPSAEMSSRFDISWMAVADDMDYVLELSGLGSGTLGASEKAEIVKKLKKMSVSSGSFIKNQGG